MPQKKKASEHKLHAMVISFSVIAGLALAACQPNATQQTASPQPTVVPDQGMESTLPESNDGSMMQYEGPDTMPAENPVGTDMNGAVQTTPPTGGTGTELQ